MMVPIRGIARFSDCLARVPVFYYFSSILQRVAGVFRPKLLSSRFFSQNWSFVAISMEKAFRYSVCLMVQFVLCKSFSKGTLKQFLSRLFRFQEKVFFREN